MTPVICFSLLGVLGLCIGSFLNVVIYRLPRMLEQEWRAQCLDFLKLPAEKQSRYNLASPGSHCLQCEHPIKLLHNIPLLSYLFLRGRCSYCTHPIPIRYPLIELASALLAVFLAWHYGFTGQMAAALLLSWSLLCLVFIDFDHQILPDNLTLPLLWLGLAINMFGLWTDIHSAIMGAIVGYLSLWTITWLFHRITGKIGMGHGDFKLLAALGAWLGWQALPMIILLSSLLGSLVGISLMIFKNHHRHTPIPFGPYLAIAGWIVLLYGQSILQRFL
ncbi:MAG: prepilin peptidase [Gammaproteobacteria bacterium]